MTFREEWSVTIRADHEWPLFVHPPHRMCSIEGQHDAAECGLQQIIPRSPEWDCDCEHHVCRHPDAEYPEHP